MAERSDLPQAEPHLSRPVQAGAGGPGQCITFVLAEEEIAVGILQVREILSVGPITRVPEAPTWIRGVINLRGAVVPVVDLGVKLGFGTTMIGPRSCLVVVEAELEDETVVLAMLVDAMQRVIELTADDVEPAPSFGTRVSPEYLLGMGRVGEFFMPLLDLQRTLAEDELASAVALEPDSAPEAGAKDDDKGRGKPHRKAPKPRRDLEGGKA